MDISDTIAPNSDQLDAVDLLSGPRTFTIESVSKGNPEQPVQIHLAEFPRPWRPGKSMRRVLIATWGADAAAYVGRRLTLFCDNTVRFGGAEVGGVRISHMSHLSKRKAIPLLVSKGRSAMFTVEPLVDEPPAPTTPAPLTEADVAACTDVRVLREWWADRRTQHLRGVIEARVNALNDAPPTQDEELF